MIFHILQNQITTLFLGLNLITTMTFDSEIQSYIYGGGKEDVFFQVTNNRRTLVLKALQKQNLSNLLIITKGRKYYMDLEYDESNSHQFLEVKDGVANHALKVKTSTIAYDILEGASSVLFVNKTPNEMMVNGRSVKRSEYFSKGVPLILESRRILN